MKVKGFAFAWSAQLMSSVVESASPVLSSLARPSHRQTEISKNPGLSHRRLRAGQSLWNPGFRWLPSLVRWQSLEFQSNGRWAILLAPSYRLPPPAITGYALLLTDCKAVKWITSDKITGKPKQSSPMDA